MTYLGDKDFLIEVQKGNVDGHSIVHKFGRNNAVPNGTWEIVSMLSSATSAGFPSSASTVRIKAGGNANDTAAGTGAREVTVVGIDDNLAEVSEAIATAGTSASSATTASFWRVYRVYVSAVGAYNGTNAAVITIEDSGGAADYIIIPVGGQSQYAAFAIPTGKTGYLLGADINADSNQAADIRFFIRDSLNDTSVPVEALRHQLFFAGVNGAFSFKPRSPIVLNAVSDLWWEARGSGGATDVSVDFEILLVDD